MQNSWKKRAGESKESTTQHQKKGEPPSSSGGNSGRSSGQEWGGQRGNRWGNNHGKPDKTSVVCYNCHKTGHYKSECPDSKVKMGRMKSPGRIEGQKLMVRNAPWS